MELRLIVSESEKRTFAERMAQARTTRNGGFRETPCSNMGRIHLQFGQLYGLFDDAGPYPDQMIAGLIIHDLASFALSYPKPDFSHYQPERVFEVGELWSLAKGLGAFLLQRGGLILAGLRQAQAVVGYAIVEPWNLTRLYRGLVPVGEPIEWPYVTTLEGGKIFCQAMVAEGEHLRRYVEKAFAVGFETYDNHRRIRFPEYVGELPAHEEIFVPLPGLAAGMGSNGVAHL